MKIGILTLPFNNNYGGYLQAYALMSVLKDMGHDVELIYRRCNKRPMSYRIKHTIKTIIKIVLGMNHGPIIANIEKEHRAKGEMMMPFVDKYITPKTRPLLSTEELAHECKGKYDAIVVGSDQVWRPNYVPNIENFFLDFVEGEDIKKIAYAASFGNDNPGYTNSQKANCGILIEKFDKVSLREESGINVIRSFGWKTQHEAEVVLDPTMLLSKSYYETILTNIENKGSYLLSYVLDENLEARELIEHVCNTLGKKEYSVIDTKKWKRIGYKMPTIETWLDAFYNAEFVITDSFHGTVFSIIFNKPFIVYANKDRGIDRFTTLLKHVGLEDRIITPSSSVKEILAKRVNWDSVNEKIRKKKESSINFLVDILS